MIKVANIGLPEQSENIIKKMSKNRTEQRARRIKSQGKDSARKQIDGKIFQIEMHQREEYRAEGNGAKDTARFIFTAKNSAMHCKSVIAHWSLLRRG